MRKVIESLQFDWNADGAGPNVERGDDDDLEADHDMIEQQGLVAHLGFISRLRFSVDGLF